MAAEGVENEYIGEEDGMNMVPKEPKAARFYMSSKNHKPVVPETGVPPWREVASGSGSNTEGASKICSHYLNPINMKVASYLEDTRHMVVKVKDLNRRSAPLSKSTRLVSVDVVAMYPSIPAEGERGGVEASRRALDTSGMEAGKVEWVMKLLKVVLQGNMMEWDGALFLQCFGTSIRTSCAPPYSGIYLEELVLKTFSLWEETHPNPEENMTEWARLIDDGWGLWEGSLNLLRQWLQFMNSQVLSIKFTMTYTCPKDCPEKSEEEHECRDIVEY